MTPHRYRPTRALWPLTALLACAACTPEAAPGDPANPQVLAHTLAGAARARDYATLSAHMAERFSYSFGREPSRAGALAAFRAEPGRLDRLARTLETECAYRDAGEERWFVCPAAAADETEPYYDWRAGFRRKADGTWELAWFVAGD
ncbi:MAG TPA: hypothetical protein VKZ85_06065 [Woeseiaceae bacterium]|nr:hypothetical protein [Woeseiaceae bacterium]